MNREQITPEIVELARKLKDAGYRQEIREGDWYLFSSTKKAMRDVLCLHSGTKPIDLSAVDKYTTIIPIPDLSTCLAWLRNEVVDPCVELSVDNMWVCRITIGTDFIANCDYTPLEACYLAMIKILGGE